MLLETPDFLMRQCGKAPTIFRSIKITQINNSTLLSFSSCRITLAWSFHKSVQILSIVLATEHRKTTTNIVRCNESEICCFEQYMMGANWEETMQAQNGTACVACQKWICNGFFETSIAGVIFVSNIVAILVHNEMKRGRSTQ